MRKTLGAALLLVTLCCPALAGEIPNPPAPQPHGMTTGEPPTDNATLNGEVTTTFASDILAETALELLAVLPTLL
ncbi:MAG: hypothetical protein QOH49_1239 [Acidobacteriota bacterium]|nr:hypothetical protein [Acidobacteriota bacterium]